MATTETAKVISNVTTEANKESQKASLQQLSARFTAWAQRADSLLKVSAVLLAGLYLLGLMISNESLAKIGLSDFSLVRIKCILTGIWSLCLILIGSIPTLFVNLYMAESEQQTTRFKFPRPCSSTLLLCWWRS